MSIDKSVARPSDEKLTLVEHLARRLSLKQLIFAIVMTFFLVSILFPFYWMVSSSFKSYAEIGGREAVYIPGALRLDAYQELFDPAHESFQGFFRNMVNTLIISIPTALVAVILSTLGAYAITRMRFRGSGALLNGILLVCVGRAEPVEIATHVRDVPLLVLMGPEAARWERPHGGSAGRLIQSRHDGSATQTTSSQPSVGATSVTALA